VGIGRAQWNELNSHRGRFYTPPKRSSSARSSSAEETQISFPLFNSDPFDMTAPATKYDVATNAASTMWNRALSYAANGKEDEANRLKTQVIRSSSEKVVNTLGYTFLNDGYTSLAIDVFTRNAEAHTDSWQAYYSLGEAWSYRRDTLTALTNFNKALSLTSDTATKAKIQRKIDTLLG
jgi:Flp pilus assembly protein TadD